MPRIMRVPFIKMHGLGNDFVVLDARVGDLPPVSRALAAGLADRRTGIGCDQLLVLEPSARADLFMRIFNADGSEAGACGNASRAIALMEGGMLRIETASGVIEAQPADAGIAVEMGAPRFDWDAIPLAYPMDTLAMPVAWGELASPAAVNVGNPHVVFFVPDQEHIALETLGPEIESDPLFPDGVNVNLATLLSRTAISLRVWERGAGLTRACGTGACATAVAAMRRGLVDQEVEVRLPGGALQIAWDGGERLLMTGPAAESFRGTFAWGDYA